MQIQQPANDSVTEYEISGVGIKEAVQESVKTKTNICFVSDRDNLGTLLRAGYFLASRDTNGQLTPIKWFEKEKISIVIKKNQLGNSGTGRLHVNFSHSKKHEKHFSVLLPIKKEEVRCRCIFRVEKDGTKNFIIMLDFKVQRKGKYFWKPIVRYDCAHGFIHKDVLNGSSEKALRKEKLPTQDKLKAIEFIINELLSDLKRRGVFSSESKISEVQALGAIKKTQEKLIKLFRSPDVFHQLESTMVAFSEEKTSIIKVKKEEIIALRKQNFS